MAYREPTWWLGYPIWLSLRTIGYSVKIDGDGQYVLYTVSVQPDHRKKIRGKANLELLPDSDLPSSIQDTVVEDSNTYKWLITKRFAEFAALNDALCERNVNVPSFPRRTLAKSFTSDYIKRRIAQLNAYFAAISERRDIMSCEIVHNFFDYPKHSKLYLEMTAPRIPSYISYAYMANTKCSPVFDVAIFQLLYDPKSSRIVIGNTPPLWNQRVDFLFSPFKLLKDSNANEAATSNISIWKINNAYEMLMLGEKWFSSQLTAFDYNFDEDLLCAGSNDGNIFMSSFTPEQSEGKKYRVVDGSIKALVYEKKLNYIICGGSSSSLKFFHTRKQAVLFDMDCIRPIKQLIFDETSALLFAACGTGGVLVFNCTNVPQFVLFFGSADDPLVSASHSLAITCFAFDSDTKRFFTAGQDRRICVWDMKSMALLPASLILRITASMHEITCMIWQRGRNELLCGNIRGKIIVLNTILCVISYVFDAHMSALTCMQHDPTRGILFTAAGKEKSVRIWEFTPYSQFVKQSSRSSAPQNESNTDIKKKNYGVRDDVSEDLIDFDDPGSDSKFGNSIEKVSREVLKDPLLNYRLSN